MVGRTFVVCVEVVCRQRHAFVRGGRRNFLVICMEKHNMKMVLIIQTMQSWALQAGPGVTL